MTAINSKVIPAKKIYWCFALHKCWPRQEMVKQYTSSDGFPAIALLAFKHLFFLVFR